MSWIITLALIAAAVCVRAENLIEWESTRPLPAFAPGASAVVVASSNDVFRVQRIGMLLLDNHARDYPVPDWQLAEHLERYAAQILSSRAGIAAKALDDAAVRTEVHDFDRYSNTASRKQRERMREVVRNAGQRFNVDYVVVVNGANSVTDPFFDTKVSLPHFGIVQNENPLSSPAALIQVHTLLLIFDARSGDQLSFSRQAHTAAHALVPPDRDLSGQEVEAERSQIFNLFEMAVATSVRNMIELREDSGHNRPKPHRAAATD